MGKRLVIAEKPSVARDIARALGNFRVHKDKRGEYFENSKYIIASSVGHLLEITPPPGVEDSKGKWVLDNLPIIPERFDLKPIEQTAPRLQLLQELIRRPDVECIINACDAGREGELIFRYIMRYTKNTKPIKRLWLQSMRPEAIQEAFERLRSDEEMQPLAYAAICRSEADWLVGINGTRAMTAFRSPPKGFRLTTVGRVQTPTLAIVVEREKAIQSFVPRKYWELLVTFQTPSGTYIGKWFDKEFNKTAKEKDPDLKPERIWQKEQANCIAQAIIGKEGEASDESKLVQRVPPLLFDLTSLQREANNRFGFSAHQTLSIAQSLYERYKLITYPRTDSRALPEDYIESVKEILKQLLAADIMPHLIQPILENKWIKPDKRIFNNKQVSDHFAIIPTGIKPEGLTNPERKIFELILKQFIAIFYPPAKILETTRTTWIDSYYFKSQGKIIIEPGWMIVHGKEVISSEPEQLPPLPNPPKVVAIDFKIEENETKPPPRFTEATLLSAMEGAGKLIEDEELRAAIAEKGLGTPATRAQIIENLIHERYLERKGKELVPTPKAFELMQLLERFQILDLTKPELTGEWEYKLKRIERRELKPEDFMEGIRALVVRIVERIKSHANESSLLPIACPRCGGECVETIHDVTCNSCNWKIARMLHSRHFTREEIISLITNKQIGPLEGFISKKNKQPFSAIIYLDDDFVPRLRFVGPSHHAILQDQGNREKLGTCPICGAEVLAYGKLYACQNATTQDNPSCTFKIPRALLGREFSPQEICTLLKEKRLGPLEGFVSKKGRFHFKASIILKNDGQIEFEFENQSKRIDDIHKKLTEKPNIEQTQVLGYCPKCKGNVLLHPHAYVCANYWNEQNHCDFFIERQISNRTLHPHEIAQLLKEGKIGPLDGFKSKKNRAFKASIVLTSTGKIKFEFENKSYKSRARSSKKDSK